jgi:hypothetical protein
MTSYNAPGEVISFSLENDFVWKNKWPTSKTKRFRIQKDKGAKTYAYGVMTPNRKNGQGNVGKQLRYVKILSMDDWDGIIELLDKFIGEERSIIVFAPPQSNPADEHQVLSLGFRKGFIEGKHQIYTHRFLVAQPDQDLRY